MTVFVNRAGLQVADVLADFVEQRALSETGIAADALWAGLADILSRFTPVNRALLAKRDDLQSKIDAWHTANPGPIADMPAYQASMPRGSRCRTEPVATEALPPRRSSSPMRP